MVGIGVFWSLALTGFCMLTAALTATISDQVPVNQRGYVSGWMSAPQAIGTILGLMLVTDALRRPVPRLRGHGRAAGAAGAAVPASCRTPCCRRSSAADADLRGTLIQASGSARASYPDFGWTLLSRMLVNFGNAFGTTLLLYFLMFGLERTRTPRTT